VIVGAVGLFVLRAQVVKCWEFVGVVDVVVAGDFTGADAAWIAVGLHFPHEIAYLGKFLSQSFQGSLALCFVLADVDLRRDGRCKNKHLDGECELAIYHKSMTIARTPGSWACRLNCFCAASIHG
jgi:hypothetical protein